MTEKPFKFKQFIVYHQQSTLKVGTDAVLLGSWADTANAKKILDIGCGSGVISLMLAQRSSAYIDGIDIDTTSTAEAERNAEISMWKDRICFQNISLQEFVKSKHENYDLIVSNPPYFNNSLKSNNSVKNLAKHNDSLNYEELASGVSALLSEDGKACFVFAVSEGRQFIQIARQFGLHCHLEMEVFPRNGLKSNRLLLQFSKNTQFLQRQSLFIKDENNHYTKEYIHLTKPFYINLPSIE